VGLYKTVMGTTAEPRIIHDNQGETALKATSHRNKEQTRAGISPVREVVRHHMAAPRNLRVLPGGRINGLQRRTVTAPGEAVRTRANAGPVLLLGGTTYAAAYLVLGVSGLTGWSGLLAIAGTALILFGLRRTWERT